MNLASLLNACMTNLEGTRPSGAGIQSTVDAARWEPADVRFLDMTAVTRFWPESATTAVSSFRAFWHRRPVARTKCSTTSSSSRVLVADSYHRCTPSLQHCSYRADGNVRSLGRDASARALKG